MAKHKHNMRCPNCDAPIQNWFQACYGCNPAAVRDMLAALEAVRNDIELDSGNFNGAVGGSTELSMQVEEAIKKAKEKA